MSSDPEEPLQLPSTYDGFDDEPIALPSSSVDSARTDAVVRLGSKLTKMLFLSDKL
jgi:hypothetical protein